MQARVPIYQFYGEFLSQFDKEPIHHEKLHERSKRHDWTIKPHQHEKLAQIFYFQRSGVTINSMGMTFQTEEPTILFVPPMTVHGFNFPENMAGNVTSLQLDYLDKALAAQLASFSQGTAILLSEKNAVHFHHIIELIEQVRFNHAQVHEQRSNISTTLILLILRYIASETGPGITHQTSMSDQSLFEIKALRFCNLVEQHYHERMTIEAYAQLMEMSAPQLTRITNRILRSTPNAYIAERKLTEAKRLLRFTRQSVSDISDRCGYRDISYFSRIFKKHVGMPPLDYRKQQGN